MELASETYEISSEFQYENASLGSKSLPAAKHGKECRATLGFLTRQWESTMDQNTTINTVLSQESALAMRDAVIGQIDFARRYTLELLENTPEEQIGRAHV